MAYLLSSQLLATNWTSGLTFCRIFPPSVRRIMVIPCLIMNKTLHSLVTWSHRCSP